MEETDIRSMVCTVSPLSSLRAAMHGVNCSLDGVRSEMQKLVPKHRPMLAAAFQSAHQRRRVRAAPESRPISFRGTPFAAAIPGDGVVEQVFTTGISSFLNLYNTVLIGRIILTWFPQAPPAIVGPLATITDPYLNIFRGIIPPLGGTLDLSPILAFVCLDLFSNVAATLPCEIDGPPQSQEQSPIEKLRRVTPANAAKRLQRNLAARRQKKLSQQT